LQLLGLMPAQQLTHCTPSLPKEGVLQVLFFSPFSSQEKGVGEEFEDEEMLLSLHHAPCAVGLPP
jgi:hypothetical protein